MKSVLAKEEISDQEVIKFLQDMASQVKDKLSNIKEFDKEEVKLLMEPATSLFDLCENLSNKLINGKPLSSVESDKLKEILLLHIKHIEMGIVEGTTAGIEKYLKVLKQD